MAETKTTTPQTRNQTPLYIVCIALLVAVVLAIVGFVGKNTANQQNAELTAQLGKGREGRRHHQAGHRHDRRAGRQG